MLEKLDMLDAVVGEVVLVWLGIVEVVESLGLRDRCELEVCCLLLCCRRIVWSTASLRTLQRRPRRPLYS